MCESSFYLMSVKATAILKTQLIDIGDDQIKITMKPRERKENCNMNVLK